MSLLNIALCIMGVDFLIYKDIIHWILYLILTNQSLNNKYSQYPLTHTPYISDAH